jgi:4-hydroxy-3-methylbut-2-enyl diphosphate reductase
VTGQVLLAAPRGCCAGVDRAVSTVEKALELYGAPVYVRGEIVHNRFAVESLRRQGAVFVAQTTEVPEGAVVIFSAHGVAPAVREEAARRGLHAIDATCPLVAKVHREAVRFASSGYDVLLIGEGGHEEVIGTQGHAPTRIYLVEGVDHANVTVADPGKVAWLSQTTL